MPLRFANPVWYSMLFGRNMSIKIWTHSVIVLARPSVVALIPTASAARLGVHGTGVLNTVVQDVFRHLSLFLVVFMFIVHTAGFILDRPSVHICTVCTTNTKCKSQILKDFFNENPTPSTIIIIKLHFSHISLP
jgi:hypothetical protein